MVLINPALSRVSYDWLLVFRNNKDEDSVLERTATIRKLKAAGLAPTVCKTPSGDEIHIFVRAPLERLEMEAEMAGLKKQLLNRGGLAPFAITKRHLFVGATSPQGLFSSCEKQRLLFRALISSNRLHGAQLDLDRMKISGNLVREVPVQDRVLRQDLVEHWLPQVPLRTCGAAFEGVRDYFGECIAFYFLWISHYLESGLLLAAIGAIVGILRVILSSPSVSQSASIDVSNLIWLEIIFALLWVMWLSVYPHLWSRREYDQAYNWGVDTHDVDEEDAEILRLCRDSSRAAAAAAAAGGSFGVAGGVAGGGSISSAAAAAAGDAGEDSVLTRRHAGGRRGKKGADGWQDRSLMDWTHDRKEMLRYGSQTLQVPLQHS